MIKKAKGEAYMDKIKFCPLYSTGVKSLHGWFEEKCAWYLSDGCGGGQCALCGLGELERAATMLQGMDRSLYTGMERRP